MFAQTNREGDTSSESLLKTGQDGEQVYSRPQTRDVLLRLKILAVSSTSLLILNVLFITLSQYYSFTLSHGEAYIYSPAEDVIEYKVVVFNTNFDQDRTIYQGPPTDTVDAAWEELYNDIGLSEIDRESAERLPNKTSLIPGDGGQYIVGLDVFHQLQCLNHVRKALYPTRYHLHDNLSSQEMVAAMAHLEHCIDSIRQSLMCASDISTIYWEWDPVRRVSAPNARTTHTCRDFERIQEWARSHRLGSEWDPDVYVEDDG